MSESAPRRWSLASGFAALAHWRLVLLITTTTVALALIPALALRSALRDVFAGTLAGDHVLHNHPSFAPLDVLEFSYEKSDALASAWGTALGVGILGVFLQILYAGGLVETLGRDRRLGLAEFFAGASRNFWHNFKCFLIFGIAALITLGIWFAGTGAAGRKLFEQTPPGARVSLAYRIATVIVALLLYAWLSLAHDFARIARRYDPEVGTWRGYGLAWQILSSSWLAALALFLFWLVAGGAVWLLLLALEWEGSATSLVAIGLHGFLQLAAVVVRSAVRVGAWGSYVALADAGSAVRPSSEIQIATETGPFLSEPLAPTDVLGETPLV